ncbi:hypothetical protein [Brachybacterium sacelli]|uniref:Prophage maintenance system killer protein n=2 Tax=Brachybacterium sacelli TaxID=173364 RepID=A0ABS4WWV8_9MICO|nr:hypothetical protein [Brachybacterium sacelli]MBP2380643.1 prophage maintenance system killer protein [Brachybacterium sacelli]
MGWLAVVVFYGLNGIDLEARGDDAYDLVIAVATGRAGIDEIASALSDWR